MEPTIRLTVRLPQDVYESVKTLSDKADNSMNGQIVAMLRQAADTKLAALPDFWDLKPEERIDMLLEGFGRYVTRELP